MTPEGWYIDPFAQHEQRWFSAGTPTDLVRDGDVEGHEAPPDTRWDGPLEQPPLLAEGEVDPDPDDLARADQAAAAGADYAPQQVADAALSAGRIGGVSAL